MDTVPGVMLSHSLLEGTFLGQQDIPKAGRHAGTDFDTFSAQEELFGPSSTTSVSCSHRDLPASPTIPEEMELLEQMDPRSRFHGQATSDIPRIICHPTYTADLLGTHHPKNMSGSPQFALIEGSAPSF